MCRDANKSNGLIDDIKQYVPFHFRTNKCLKSESNDAELDDDNDVDAHPDINPGVANRELLRRGGSTAGSGSVFLRTKYVSSHAFHTIEGGSTPKWMRDVINALGEFE